MRYKNILSNDYARLVREAISEGKQTVESALNEKFNNEVDVVVVINSKGETIATTNLNSDPLVAKSKQDSPC